MDFQECFVHSRVFSPPVFKKQNAQRRRSRNSGCHQTPRAKSAILVHSGPADSSALLSILCPSAGLLMLPCHEQTCLFTCTLLRQRLRSGRVHVSVCSWSSCLNTHPLGCLNGYSLKRGKHSIPLTTVNILMVSQTMRIDVVKLLLLMEGCWPVVSVAGKYMQVLYAYG